MKPTAFIVCTDRFIFEWGDDGDASPPPGHDFAAALLERLLLAGATTKVPRVTRDDWEHNYWYISVIWNGTEYTLFVEASIEPTVQPTWIVTVSKQLNMFKTLFGASHLRYDVDDEFLQFVEDQLVEFAPADAIDRATADEVASRFLGAPD